MIAAIFALISGLGLFAALITIMSELSSVTGTLLSYPGILREFVTFLPAPLMAVVCGMFLISISLVAIKALIQKV